MSSDRLNGFKLLVLIDGLGTGGAERSLAESLPHLLDLGVRPDIVYFKQREEGVEMLVRSTGVGLIKLQHETALGRIVELRRIIKKLRPDLIHTVLFESTILGRLAATGLNVPVLTSLVNTTYDSAHRRDPNLSPWKLRAAKSIDVWTARHLTTHFHAISRAVKSAAIDHLRVSPERITVVERGRDAARLGEPTSERRRGVRARLGIGPDTPLVLSVGRNEYQKGQEFLIRAIDCLGDPRLTLLIAGRVGKATPHLQQLIEERGLTEQVVLMGHREDLPDLLATADVFVYPSLYEGLGGAMIEAMYMGLPIIASDLPAIRDATENGRCAVLVPPADPDALAAAIRDVLQNGSWSRFLGQVATETFLKRFDLEQSVKRLTEVYSWVTDR